MAKECSFDIVSEYNKQELVNAIDQVKRELTSRFDLKNSNSDVDLDECEWEEVETSTTANLPATTLNEAIDQLKQTNSSIEKDESHLLYHEQASLESFYSEQLREQLDEEQAIKKVETSLPSKSRKTIELKIPLLVVGIIILATFVYIILQSKYAI